MKIVLATANAHKIIELQAILPDTLELVTQHSLGVQAAVENGLSFVENAIIKARNAARQTGLPAIADDSGLEVDLLDGAPGIYSSRYAGTEAGDNENNEKLLAALKGYSAELRTARFRSVIVFMKNASDPSPVIASGTLSGRIGLTVVGSNGFGYDPLFFLPSQNRTVAQLTDQEKNLISHRAKALVQLKSLVSFES